MKTSHVSKPHYDEKGYDTFVHDDDNLIYAIYDGMGVSEGSRYASTYCKQRTEALANILTIGHAAELAKQLDIFAMAIGKTTDGGTTGVIIRINNDDEIEYAMMGDSRLYIYNNGEAIQIGRDEGVGNMLNNYIGRYTLGCQQWGVVPEWDKFMICSDGITGDWPDQFIDPVDIKEAFELDTPRAICNKFVELSRKPDDKTILVGAK